MILCDPSSVNVKRLESLLPGIRCLSLQTETHRTIAERYSDYALATFERIQAILQGKPQRNVLVHVVVVDHREQALLAGLSALLKTAALEHPQIAAQLILVRPQATAEELARQLKAEQVRALDPVIRMTKAPGSPTLASDPGTRGRPPIAFQDQAST